MSVIVRGAGAEDRAEWLRMRLLLWPHCPPVQHTDEMTASLARPDSAVFVAARPTDGLCGFLEAAIWPYAEGCETHSVGYIEGWYVDADMRQNGVGRLLVQAAEAWARSRGCREMASDTEVENVESQRAHAALGFQETARLVHFRKRLDGEPTVEGMAALRSLTLLLLNNRFAICRLGADDLVPAWALAVRFFSITRTDDELSVICPVEAVPEGVRCERGWRCLRVAGVLPFSAIGVLASLTGPLATAGISVFAVSTFDTDYLLVKAGDLAKACEALRDAGPSIRDGL
jgi:aminoglycoside 6'-N-acetyltransferase I